jgi:hypothetical protein
MQERTHEVDYPAMQKEILDVQNCKIRLRVDLSTIVMQGRPYIEWNMQLCKT